MGASKLGAIASVVCAVILGVILSGYRGAGVALLVLSAALVFAGIGALIGRVGGVIINRSRHSSAQR